MLVQLQNTIITIVSNIILTVAQVATLQKTAKVERTPMIYRCAQTPTLTGDDALCVMSHIRIIAHEDRNMSAPRQRTDALNFCVLLRVATIATLHSYSLFTLFFFNMINLKKRKLIEIENLRSFAFTIGSF